MQHPGFLFTSAARYLIQCKPLFPKEIILKEENSWKSSLEMKSKQIPKVAFTEEPEKLSLLIIDLLTKAYDQFKTFNFSHRMNSYIASFIAKENLENQNLDTANK